MKTEDTIKTFEDACKATNTPEQLPDMSSFPEEEREAILNYYKMRIIAKALNGDWKPNWSNWDERKWFPWFDLESGFAFSSTDYRCTITNTRVGSRLVFKTRELAEYAGKQFERIYKEFLTK